MSAAIRPLPAGRAGRVRRRARRAAGADRRRRRHRGARPGAGPARLPGAAARSLLPLARHRLRVAPRAPAAPRRAADRRAGRLSTRGRRRRRRERGRPRRGRARRLAAAGRARPSRKGEEVDLGEVGGRLVEAGYERTDQVEERGQFAVRGGHPRRLPAPPRTAPRGSSCSATRSSQIRWFSTFTQRSLGDADAIELAPAAELGSEHRELAELALEAEDGRAAAPGPRRSFCRSTASARRWT